MDRMRAVVVASMLAVGACGESPTAVIDSERMDPVPDQYREWYADVEACAGLSGDFEAVVWMVASRIRIGDAPAAGATKFPHTVVIHRQALMSPEVVRHEALHHITQIGDALHGSDLMARCAYEAM